MRRLMDSNEKVSNANGKTGMDSQKTSKKDEARVRLGSMMHERRLFLGLPQTGLEGLNAETVAKYERGDFGTPRAGTFEKFEKALQWNAGTCWAILRGGIPPIVGGGRLAEMADNVDQLIALAEAGDRPKEVLVYARSLRDLVKELTGAVNDLAEGDQALRNVESNIDDLEN